MVNRVASGVLGLDEIIGGGFESGSVTLISGKCGTAKTIFGLQFAYFGAINNQPSLYVSFEEEEPELEKTLSMLGMELPDDKKKNLQMMYMNPLIFKAILRNIEDKIKEIGAKRVVIDSITSLTLKYQSKIEIKTSLHELFLLLKRHGITSIVLSQISGKGELSSHGVEEYLSDGVILLNYEDNGYKYERSITVRKMRRTKHTDIVFPITISNDRGLSVVHEEYF